MRWPLLVVLPLTLGACGSLESSRCEVHGDPLVLRRVPIHYGLMDGQYLDDRESSFPHASRLGGCVIDDDEPTTTAPCCDTCREAEATWARGARGRRRSLDTFDERDRLLDPR